MKNICTCMSKKQENHEKLRKTRLSPSPSHYHYRVATLNLSEIHRVFPVLTIFPCVFLCKKFHILFLYIGLLQLLNHNLNLKMIIKSLKFPVFSLSEKIDNQISRAVATLHHRTFFHTCLYYYMECSYRMFVSSPLNVISLNVSSAEKRIYDRSKCAHKLSYLLKINKLLKQKKTTKENCGFGCMLTLTRKTISLFNIQPCTSVSSDGI